MLLKACTCSPELEQNSNAQNQNLSDWYEWLTEYKRTVCLRKDQSLQLCSSQTYVCFSEARSSSQQQFRHGTDGRVLEYKCTLVAIITSLFDRMSTGMGQLCRTSHVRLRLADVQSFRYLIILPYQLTHVTVPSKAWKLTDPPGSLLRPEYLWLTVKRVRNWKLHKVPTRRSTLRM